MIYKTGGANAQKVLPRIMAAAIGLAADFFRIEEGPMTWTTTRAHALFILDGHISVWSDWADDSRLSDGQRVRYARLLKSRVNDLANALTAGEVLDRLLLAGEVSGCRAGEDYKEGMDGSVIVDAGMPLADFIDGALDDLAELHAASRRSLPPAEAGPHTTYIRVPAARGSRLYPGFRFEIEPHHQDPGVQIPAVVDAPPLEQRLVPFDALREIAVDLDQDKRILGDHRRKAVDKFESEVRSRDAGKLTGLLLTTGPLNELLAYTGFGKSVVLVEVFACWAIKNDVTVSFVLPTNADVVKAAYQIEQAVGALGLAGKVVALTSPNSRIDVARQAAARVSSSGPTADWVWDQFGYGCALAALATSDNDDDAWVPGSEPCVKLREHRHKDKDRTVACPWRTTCGRFQASRAACTADVIVTSHVNLMQGVLQTPVLDGHGVNDRLSVEELLMRRCQVVVIDEVDVFQQEAIEQAGRGLVLDHAGRTNTPLRALDAEFAAAFGALRDEVDANVRDAYFGLRYLSETYVSHLNYNRLGPARPGKGRRPPGPGRAWIVPRRRDNWLAAKLFDVDPDAVSEEQMAMFLTLFPGERTPLSTRPPTFDRARTRLEQVVSPGFAGVSILDARHAIGELVPHASADDRREFVDGVLRRAILERIRMFLHRLMANNAQLVDIGVESAMEIAEALGTYGRWRAMPTGPLGRLVFAFTEFFDDSGSHMARLSTAAFGGDPHTYTVDLGDITALAHAGTRRIVLGLSATSYFPVAPQHHLHTKPRWWVRDESPGQVRIESAVIADADNKPLRISGLEGAHRAEATRRIAARLWTKYLVPEFERLSREDRDRQRVLLATTSYEAARHVAEGLAEADVEPQRICLAIPPRFTPTADGMWRELRADQLESFAKKQDADILIAPLARVQRGVNIIGKDSKSALGSVWLIVRPIPIIDEPAELVAHIQAKGLAEHAGPVKDPLALLAARRRETGTFLDEIIRCPPYFQSQPQDVKLGVTAEIIIGAIQLIGRARRGGTSAVLHLVDGAFHGDDHGTGLPSLITRLRDEWRAEELRDMQEYYGSTLEAFLDYAVRHTDGALPC